MKNKKKSSQKNVFGDLEKPFNVDLPVSWDIWFNQLEEMNCNLKSINDALWEIVGIMRKGEEPDGGV